jgi:hypothetical protein
VSKASSSKSIRALTWVSALVLVAGVIAFATVKIGGDDSPEPVAQSEPLPEGSSFIPEAPKPEPVPAAAQQVAGAFILAAAGREDLKKAWKLAHPDLKRDCACTYEEWLTGNIPVVFYPTDGLQGASFAVDESTKNRVVLQVALSPAKDSDVEPQAFYIGLKAVGQGAERRWLVDYWAPIGATPIPQVG